MEPFDAAALPGAVLLVGAGKMGAAMLEGWLAQGVPAGKVIVLEPQPSAEIDALHASGLRLNPEPTAVGAVSALVLAIKPQVAPEVVPGLRRLVGPATVAISIMAGRTLGFLEDALPGAAAVRTMPNLPALRGSGLGAHERAGERKLKKRLRAGERLPAPPCCHFRSERNGGEGNPTT